MRGDGFKTLQMLVQIDMICKYVDQKGSVEMLTSILYTVSRCHTREESEDYEGEKA